MPAPRPPSTDATGCLVCGDAIEYLQEAAPVECAFCGAAFRSAARCVRGHYVCDRCHAAPAAEVIERFCAQTGISDPVEIALTLMRHPAVKMHGPEHHFLVPAALLAAWSNATSAPAERRAALVR